MTDLQGMSLAEAQAYVKRLQEEAKTLESQQKAELAAEGADFINLVIATQPMSTTESTGRHGISVNSMPFTGENGRSYTVSLHVTDVALTEVGKKAVAEKKAAEERAAALQDAAKSNPALAETLKKIGVV